MRYEWLGGGEPRPASMEGLIPVDPTELGAFELVAPGMVQQARMLHAAAYYRHGYVTEAGIDPESGTLVPTIDPPKIIEASTYIGALDPEGLEVNGCIRLIHPLGDDLLSLPTIAKLKEQSPRHYEALPFVLDPAGRVYEASALAARPNRSPDPTLATRLILACTCMALKHDYDYAVVGVVEETAKFLVSMYGPEAFVRIGDETTIIRLRDNPLAPPAQKLYRPTGINLIPFCVDMQRLAEQAQRHYAKRRMPMQRVLQLLQITREWARDLEKESRHRLVP